jgi:hypothetical protein
LAVISNDVNDASREFSRVAYSGQRHTSDKDEPNSEATRSRTEWKWNLGYLLQGRMRLRSLLIFLEDATYICQAVEELTVVAHGVMSLELADCNLYAHNGPI